MLNARLDPEAGVDWDVAAVFLGTNYGGDIEVYTRELDQILERLAPRPTLLYTVTEFRPNRADVNAAIQGMLAYYPNVQIIDWATDDRGGSEPARLPTATTRARRGSRDSCSRRRTRSVERRPAAAAIA